MAYTSRRARASEDEVGYDTCVSTIHTQEIQPYQFGHPVQKKTRLWLKGLPLLKPTEVVDYKCGCHEAGTWFMKGGKERQKNRSKTFPGIAKAMAEQWAGRKEGL